MRITILTVFVFFVSNCFSQDLLLPDTLQHLNKNLKENISFFLEEFDDIPSRKNIVVCVKVEMISKNQNCLKYTVELVSFTCEYKYINFDYCEWVNEGVYLVFFENNIENKTISGFNLHKINDLDKKRVFNKLIVAEGITGSSFGFYYEECNGRRKKYDFPVME